MKQHKKTLLFERRNKKVKHLGVFAGNKSELLGEDVEDDILSRKEQEQVNAVCGTCSPHSTVCGTCSPHSAVCGTCSPHSAVCGIINIIQVVFVKLEL